MSQHTYTLSCYLNVFPRRSISRCREDICNIPSTVAFHISRVDYPVYCVGSVSAGRSTLPPEPSNSLRYVLYLVFTTYPCSEWLMVCIGVSSGRNTISGSIPIFVSILLVERSCNSDRVTNHRPPSFQGPDVSAQLWKLWGKYPLPKYLHMCTSVHVLMYVGKDVG